MNFKLKSSLENKTLLLEMVDADYIQIKIEGENISVCHKSYLYTDGKSLVNFFKNISELIGQEKEWSSIESDFSLKTTTSKNGHITLKVKLIHNQDAFDWWEYQTSFDIEIGQMYNVTHFMCTTDCR
jgi:hypothetical protein